VRYGDTGITLIFFSHYSQRRGFSENTYLIYSFTLRCTVRKPRKDILSVAHSLRDINALPSASIYLLHRNVNHANPFHRSELLPLFTQKTLRAVTYTVSTATAASFLEALTVHNGRSGLVVLFLADPHTLEGREGGKNGSTDPDRVLTLRRSDDLNLDGSGGKSGDLLGHTLTDSGEHGGTSGENNVGVQVLTDIDIALHDGLEGGVGNTVHFKTSQVRLEEDLRTTESLVTNDDDVTIGKLEGLLEGTGLGGLLHLLLEVNGDEAQGFLDVTNDFTFGRGGEGVTTLGENLHEVVGKVTSGKIETDDGVGKSVTFVDRDSVGDTISRVQNTSGGTTGSVQGKDGLNVDVHGRDIESLKHDLGHTFTVSLGVLRSLSKENRVGLGGDTELIVEGVMPDLLHIVPVGNDTVLDGVLQGENTTLGLSLITDVSVTLFHTNLLKREEKGVYKVSHCHVGRQS